MPQAAEGDTMPARVVRDRFGCDWLVLRVLQDLVQIEKSKIFCLQDFSGAGFLDLTFFALADCTAFYERCSRLRDHERMRGIKVSPLFALEEVPITVHLYNPYVEDGLIRAFLGRYCSSVSAGEQLRGRFGIWNGKRKFQVRLRADPAVPGAYLHPPGSFAIGPHQGFLHYPGQPLYCRRCGGPGHTKEACTGLRCRFCGEEGHVAANCRAPKSCSLCGSRDHLFRDCPEKSAPAASVVTGGPVGRPSPSLTTNQHQTPLPLLPPGNGTLSLTRTAKSPRDPRLRRPKSSTSSTPASVPDCGWGVCGTALWGLWVCGTLLGSGGFLRVG
uniref:CCHC-type domain-containing protein n=1 Tax=Astyanax mexicanus TaxID=7994 RepID=A0A3B1IGK5_ASTMX